jgi:pimeloyl-ACP methyl ester carboxylesterase
MSNPRHVASERAMRFFQSPVAPLLARPWMDTLALHILRHYFFPSSRLWAMAREAEGNLDHFLKDLDTSGLRTRRFGKLRNTLEQFERKRLKAFMVEPLWHDYLFGAAEAPLERLLIAEEMRLDARTAYNMTRRAFLPFRGLLQASVKMTPPAPQQLITRFGERGEGVDTLFEIPSEFPEVEVSRSIPVPGGSDYWLRFPSPAAQMNDMVYARVHEPAGVENPPTLIFGHGICVEFDHYHNLVDEVAGLTARGIRVVRPEAPWHGRRVLPGHFGGEQLLSTAPTGMFDFLGAQHQEWAVLMDWCRRAGSGPVAVGGSSLGAQTAKSIAMRAVNWPQRLRPDALLAIIHTNAIAQTALNSSLSDIWNLSGALRDAGWSKGLSEQWLQRLDPLQPSCMPAENVVSVTGSADSVTLESEAQHQLDYWQVPQQNRFSYRRGHFTVPLGMLRDTQPLDRFREVLRTCER